MQIGRFKIQIFVLMVMIMMFIVFMMVSMFMSMTAIIEDYGANNIYRKPIKAMSSA